MSSQTKDGTEETDLACVFGSSYRLVCNKCSGWRIRFTTISNMSLGWRGTPDGGKSARDIAIKLPLKATAAALVLLL